MTKKTLQVATKRSQMNPCYRDKGCVITIEDQHMPIILYESTLKHMSLTVRCHRPPAGKHHRVEKKIIALQPPQSLDKTSVKAAMKIKIKYPLSHDKVWTKSTKNLK